MDRGHEPRKPWRAAALATLIALRHKWSLRDRDSDVQLVLRLG